MNREGRNEPDVLILPVPHGGWRVSMRAVSEVDAAGLLGFVQSVDGGFETLALSHPEDYPLFNAFDEALRYLIEHGVDRVRIHDEPCERSAADKPPTSQEATANDVTVTTEAGERIALIFDEPRGRGPSVFFRGLTGRLPRISGPYESVDVAIRACRRWYQASQSGSARR